MDFDQDLQEMSEFSHHMIQSSRSFLAPRSARNIEARISLLDQFVLLFSVFAGALLS